jgi:hypothetical protein
MEIKSALINENPLVDGREIYVLFDVALRK